MKLYHFTSPVHVEGCKKQGLTKGMIPLYKNGQYKLLPGWQWLTTNPNFNQVWCEHSRLAYDRTAFRLTINIPKSAQKQLFKWLEICKKLPIDEAMNECNDAGNWFVFFGRVKPGWVREVIEKEVKENG